MFYLKYRFRVISILVPAVLFVSACTQPMATDSQARLTRNAVPSSLAHIPFAGDDELAAIDSRKDSSIIPWKLARRLAYFEFREYYAREFGWQGNTLSERPVVVYDTNSKPKLYEFIVYNPLNGTQGTLVAYATKNSTGSIAYSLPYVRKYPLLSKSPGYGEIDIMYPNSLLVGVMGKAGNEPIGIIDPQSGQSAELLEPADISNRFQEMRNLSDEKLYEGYGLASQAEFEARAAGYWEQMQEMQTDKKEYWSAIDKYTRKLMELTDAQIDAKYSITKSPHDYYEDRNNNLYGSPRSDMSSITAKLRTRWSGWCVPSAMAWVYMAQGGKDDTLGAATYGGVTLRTAGGKVKSYYYNGAKSLDKNWVEKESKKIDGGLYADLMQKGDTYNLKGSSGAAHYNGMARMMSEGRHGALWTPWWNEVHSHIYRSDMPVFIGAMFNYIGNRSKWTGHFITLTGTIELTHKWTTRFLWWDIPHRKRVERMYLVHDNGSVTGKKTLRLPAAGSVNKGKYYGNKHADTTFYPYWVHESQLHGLTTFPYLYK